MVKNILYIVGAFLLLIACKHEASYDEDKVYAVYTIDAFENRTFADARVDFYEKNTSGGKIVLEEPAEVFIEDQAMGFVSSGDYYSRNINFDSKSGGTFYYSNTQHQILENKVEVPFVALPEVIDSISKSEGVEISWTGSPLGSNEEIILTIRDNRFLKSEQVKENAAGATSIFLPADVLQSFSTGENYLELMRENKKGLQEATAVGGIRIGRFFTTRKAVILY